MDPSTTASSLPNNEEASYEEEFEELKCIGRGNFGAAFLCKFRNTPEGQENYFIAKKIILGQLTPKEQEGAHLEAELLKQLGHPNIVAHKHTFIEKGVLIIIMEFCEYGDLAYHIRKKKSKNEKFTETEIMNWFVQLCLALEYVHSRKILHRDLKTQNIFLTADNNVKLGDFGISKVLESTADHAMTVQGTPYYMSPEVCQNKPYTYQSDIWALGCILYELVTLKHAFHAENLLGLVFKIVQEEPAEIEDPDYSDELKKLIKLLLIKDEKKRPRIMSIIKLPLVAESMRSFTYSNGKSNLNPQLRKRRTVDPEQVEKLKTQDPQTLSAADRQRLQKEQRIKEDFELKRQAALENQRTNAHVAQNRKYAQFYEPSQGTMVSHTSGVPSAHQSPYKIGHQMSSDTVSSDPRHGPQVVRQKLDASLPASSTHVNTMRAGGVLPKAGAAIMSPTGAAKVPKTYYDGFNVGGQQHGNFMSPGAQGTQRKDYLQRPQMISFIEDQPQQTDTMGSDMFQANDRSAGSSAFQVKPGSNASSDFQVNDRSAGSSAFAMTRQQQQQPMGMQNFLNPAGSNASSDFQVNDERSMPASQFQLGDGSRASSGFEVNDRSMSSHAFGASATGKSIGQVDFGIALGPGMGPPPKGNLFEDVARGLPQGTAYLQQPQIINHANQPIAVSMSANSLALTQSAAMQQVIGAGGFPQMVPMQSGTIRNPNDDRAITGNGAYNIDHFAAQFEQIQLNSGSDDDDYSDDFYDETQPSTAFHSQLRAKQAAADDESDRDDNDFDLEESLKQNRNQIVDLYNRVLEKETDDGEEHFQQYDFSDSFKQHQQKVQNAYGPENEIYKTLNPKHSQQQIKPMNERHADQREQIEQEMGNLYQTVYQMLTEEMQNDTDPRERQQVIRSICQGDPRLIQLCHKLEEIVFFEQNFSYA